MKPPSGHWPYPFWIAHRGAGKLAPENTLAAFRMGLSRGWRMFECDVKLSADGIPFLLHDSTLERTTNGHGAAGEQSWSNLSQLDAGSRYSRKFAGEPLPTLDNIAHWCQANGVTLDLEIKPSPGADEITGHAVADRVARLWQDSHVKPLLSSFSTTALQAAWSTAPELTRALLLDTPRADWLDAANELRCSAIIYRYVHWNARTVAKAKTAGLRTISYTVNRRDSMQRLIDLKTDGIVTDRLDYFLADKRQNKTKAVKNVRGARSSTKSAL